MQPPRSGASRTQRISAQNFVLDSADKIVNAMFSSQGAGQFAKSPNSTPAARPAARPVAGIVRPSGGGDSLSGTTRGWTASSAASQSGRRVAPSALTASEVYTRSTSAAPTRKVLPSTWMPSPTQQRSPLTQLGQPAEPVERARVSASPLNYRPSFPQASPVQSVEGRRRVTPFSESATTPSQKVAGAPLAVSPRLYTASPSQASTTVSPANSNQNLRSEPALQGFSQLTGAAGTPNPNFVAQDAPQLTQSLTLSSYLKNIFSIQETDEDRSSAHSDSAHKPWKALPVVVPAPVLEGSKSPSQVLSSATASLVLRTRPAPSIEPLVILPEPVLPVEEINYTQRSATSEFAWELQRSSSAKPRPERSSMRKSGSKKPKKKVDFDEEHQMVNVPKYIGKIDSQPLQAVNTGGVQPAPVPVIIPPAQAAARSAPYQPPGFVHLPPPQYITPQPQYTAPQPQYGTSQTHYSAHQPPQYSTSNAPQYLPSAGSDWQTRNIPAVQFSAAPQWQPPSNNFTYTVATATQPRVLYQPVQALGTRVVGGSASGYFYDRN